MRTAPAILSWTTDLMRDREDFEIDNGGFGDLELLPTNEEFFKDQSTDKDVSFLCYNNQIIISLLCLINILVYHFSCSWSL